MLARLFVVSVLFVLASSDLGLRETYYSIYETAEKIIADGFQVETHNVNTSDGYILEMHRIPYGRSVQAANIDRTVVFLMHGLLSASNSFIGLGAEYSLAYNLADAGYDVWMGNARGNKNSRYHVILNPDDELQKYQFFNFSFEEIGMRDLPAMIDYALAYTQKDKLHYIGHSQGGTVFLVFASMLPEYNQKISSAHLLAGVGYQEYFPNEELVQTAGMTDQIYGLALQYGVVELFPPNSTEMLPGGIFPLTYTSPDYCTGDLQMKQMCELIGVKHIMRDQSPTDQAGAALKQVAHYGQNIRDKLFRRFHYGTEANLGVYGTAEPPVYDLSLITTNVTMHYTINDTLLDERDVLAMAADMPNTDVRKVARDSFLHEDFVAALDAKELVTDFIIEAIKNGQENDGATVDSNATSVPDANTQTTTTPIADSATMNVINIYLIAFSLYVIFK